MFLLKCLEAAPAESIRKGTKKLAKNKMKGDLFSFFTQIQTHPYEFLTLYNRILPIKILKMLLTLQGIGYLKTQEEEYWYYYTTIKR